MRRPAYIEIAARIKDELLSSASARPGERLPTERQLEVRYGVSRATISRALSTLAAEGLIVTRQGSGAYIADTAPPPSAGSHLVAFVAPHIPQPTGLENPILLRLYHGLEKRARELGYQLITASANFSIAHEEALIDRFLRLGAEGIVVYPVYFPEPRRRSGAHEDHLARRWRHVPLVVADIGYEEWGRTMVVFDNQRLGADMTRMLLRHGHQRIVFMGRATERLHNSVHERRRGWSEALEQAGIAIPESYRSWPPSPLDALHDLGDTELDALAASLLALTPRPDALIAYEDGMAIGLIRALQRAGVDVPGDIRVVGFDNHATGEFFEPAFPTSQPDFSRLGEAALDALHQQITGASRRARTFVLPVPTLWREPAPVVARAPVEKGGEALTAAQ